MNPDKSHAMASRAQCICSTMGFEHATWNAQYYPENCPEAWRLAYFMNDFRAVYLPSAAWNESEAQTAAIADELEEGFELVIEWPSSYAPDIQAILGRLAPLKENIACVVLNVDGLSGVELDTVHAAISRDFNINFFSHTMSVEAQKALAKQYETGVVWRQELSETPILHTPYQVVCLPCQSLRDMKSVLEQLRPLIDQNARVGLFFEPSEHSAQRALEVRALTELMGLA